MYKVPSSVKAISFDIWKTLLKGNKDFTRPRLKLIFELLGHMNFDIENLRAAYLRADKFFNDEAERTGTDYGLGERLQMMYHDLGIEVGIPGSEALSAIQLQVGKMRLRPEFMPSFMEPDIVNTLDKLRNQGYRLGLLSNTGIDNRQVMEPVLCKLGIWDAFDIAIFSSEDGCAKPNPSLFWRMAIALDAQPHQVLHVGDNTNADYRAHEAGLQAVVYDPSGSNFPHIRSMKELLGQ